ncbi:hypothetical protein [Pseudomonas citronellolis]|uniref:hypothetical protein n=1 Tax=Pseudomonas citronellolis TaxID=53408 RepID=UPI0022BA6810|nr:hypothetical protein [Pseudomonas citronellolis]WBG65981.1 hypothetical protein ELR50_24930 [Pseudomonas citronellolis]
MANHKISSSIGYLLFTVLLISMLFPWTQLTNAFESDVQPYSFLIAAPLTITLLLAKIRHLKTTKLGLGLLLGSVLGISTAAIIISIDGIDSESLRAAYQYLYAALLFLLLYIFTNIELHNERTRRFLQRIFIFTFIIWTGVGAYQLLVDKNFLTSLVKRSVVTTDRGAISLSSEPAYFGQTLIFYATAFYLLNKTRLALLALILVPILSMSSVAVIVIILLLVLFLIARYKTRALLSIPFIALAGIYLPTLTQEISRLTDIRIFYLLDKFIHDGAYILLDGSFNIRITHFYYSHLGFLESLGLPHGAKSWPTYIDSKIGEYALLWDSGTQQTNRINSGIGGVLFEGGWFSVGLLGALFYTLRRLAKNNAEGLLLIGSVIIFMYTGYTFKTPFLYIIIALLLIRKQPSSQPYFKEKIV